MAKKPPSDRFAQKRLWTDEIVIYNRLKETLPPYHYYYYNYYYTTGSGRGENLVCPRASTFFPYQILPGIDGLQSHRPFGVEVHFSCPQTREGTTSSDKIYCCPYTYKYTRYLYIYIYSLSTPPLPLPCFPILAITYMAYILFVCNMCGRGRSPHRRNSRVNRYCSSRIFYTIYNCIIIYKCAYMRDHDDCCSSCNSLQSLFKTSI